MLTEAQVVALEKAKTEKEAHGEFESEHPGYCGAQDTFYVGNLKGVGRVYQQTFIDTYAKVACAKLYDHKTPTAAADLLNDRVIPFFDSHDVKLLTGIDRPRQRVLWQSGAPSFDSISRSRTSITRAPKPRARRPTVSGRSPSTASSPRQTSIPNPSLDRRPKTRDRRCQTGEANVKFSPLERKA